jgi:uncharacterized protein (TIGR00369 family)
VNLRELLDKWATGGSDPPPVARLLGIRLTEHGEATGTVVLDATEQHHNAMGTVHGGILCDLADVAMGVAMATVLEDGETFTTLDLQISFFQQVRKGRLTATGRIVRRGKRTSYCECEISDERSALIAKASSTCLIVAAS